MFWEKNTHVEGVFVSFLVLFLAENIYFFSQKECVYTVVNEPKDGFSPCVIFHCRLWQKKIMQVQRKRVLALDLFLAKKRHMVRERTCVYRGTLGCI